MTRHGEGAPKAPTAGPIFETATQASLNIQTSAITMSLSFCTDMDCTYILSPSVIAFLEGKAKHYGSGLAGVLFGVGWCLWADACLVSGLHNRTVPFAEYIPGLVATLAMLLMCVVRRSDTESIDAFDPASFCRQRTWLFVAYVVSFVSVIGAIALLIKHYKDNLGNPADFQIWNGWAGVGQVTCILGSGLLLFLSGGESDSAIDSYGYHGF